MFLRSNPGTPTQARRPDFIYVANQQQQQQPGLNYYDFPAIHQQQIQNQMITLQQQQQQQQMQSQTGLPTYPNGSPQRRFLSEGELLSRTTSNGLSIGNELSYVNRNNNTTDNIRELAGSPQRSVYNWKDNSPTGYIQQQMGPSSNQIYQQQMNSNNQFLGRPPLPSQSTSNQQQQYIQNQIMTSIAQQQPQQQQVRQSNVSNIINNIVASSAANSMTGYHPALRGGVQVLPPQIQASPQIKRKATPTRPISFVRALEMANSIEMTNTNYQQQQQQTNENGGSGEKSSNEMNPNVQQTQQIVDRGSIYDTNYEISV
jgi:palmitoyltransferase ZDHHC5/8